VTNPCARGKRRRNVARAHGALRDKPQLMAKKGRKDKARKQAARAPANAPATPDAEPRASDQPERVSAEDAMSSSISLPPSSAPSAEPAPRNRLASNLFIALFLAYQLLMPLRYYLGGRGYDERFSWRMFSTLRMQECKVHVEERAGDEPRAVDLDKALQIAWIGMLERYRRPVVDKLLARRCAQEGVSEVRYERSCIDTDGSALPKTTVVRACASGKLAVNEGTQASALPDAHGATR
jgi:hypothetical protein